MYFGLLKNGAEGLLGGALKNGREVDASVRQFCTPAKQDVFGSFFKLDFTSTTVPQYHPPILIRS